MDARDKLQAALAGSYTIERELTGGGMSRVFVALETRLGRRVVIKVLPADVAASVSATRFEREIMVAAGLTQANIVPVLATGQVDGVPWYTMPFIEGESLRVRLSRGPLSERDTIHVLRDVTRALAYAHDHGVIHRDIKPDNVLLSGDAAVVTDFGIAKAISASRTESGGLSTGLTQIGTSIGTPAYMAPEQAAGDPGTDKRADIYAFGCTAFELLTGRRVFAETVPHRLLAAHMSTPAPRLRDMIPDANATLDQLIASCLSKDPSERPQTARDVLAALDAALSSSGDRPAPIALAQQWTLPKALGAWGLALGVSWILARAAVVGIGLPDWTVSLVLIVAALGLPAVLATWYVQRTARRALLTTPTRTPGGSTAHSTMATMALQASPHVTWKRTWRGGAIAAGAVALLLAGVMGLRAFGIGPAASLLNAGRISKDSRVLVAQFQSTTSDTSLGTVVAQAMRTSLGQSNAVKIVTPSEVIAGLRRMQLKETAPLDDKTAGELAERGGIPLIVTGRVTSIGNGFMVSANLVRADSSIELVTLQQGANGAADLLDAVDKVARGMRSRIGESLRSLARTPPLAQATTSNLDALREYTRALEAGDAIGNYETGRVHLRLALKADSTFAMAWRKLAVYENNAGATFSAIEAAVSNAYRYRERLTDRERMEVEGYWLRSRHTRQGERYYAAHHDALSSQNNRVIDLYNLGDYAEADSVAAAEFARYDADGVKPISQIFINQAVSQVLQNKRAAAEQTLGRFRRDVTTSPSLGMVEMWIASLVSIDSALAAGRRANRAGASRLSAAVIRGDANAAIARGQFERAKPLIRAALAHEDASKFHFDPIGNGAADAVAMSALRGNDPAGIRVLDSLAGAVDRSAPRLDRPNLRLAVAYAQLGSVDKAKAQLAEFDRGASRDDQYLLWGDWQAARGEIALAEGRFDDAIAAFRISTFSDSGNVEPLWQGRTNLRMARAFDKAGKADSAIAHFDALRRPGMRIGQLVTSPDGLPISARRLGELYEAKGDLAKAIENYEAFVDLWKNADAELQPQVTEIRARIARLKALEARKG
jgi:tetratricopeptide (TPR) repeat protein